ncbi:MAG: substrate import-associated zinc metallohydrolase lipoprotein [Bacteroidota bacterium]
MKIEKIILFILLASSMASCKKEDALGSVDNIPGIGGDAWVKGPIDKWIYDSLTVAYNSTVKYKYDQFELSLSRTLVPVKEEKVIPVLSSLKKVWIDSYVAETNLNFMKKYGNKFFVLVGSGSYDQSSTAAILGSTSEDGTKIVLYQLNYFNTKSMAGFKLADSAVAREFFLTIEHEFAHVLHRNVLYPFAFPQISSKLYTEDYGNISENDARAEGFVTNYSMSQANEDFAETVSYLLILGKGGFDKLVNDINYTGTTVNGTTADVARSRLRQKEAIIASYFKQSWNIDFNSLQARTRAAFASLIY